MQEVGSNKRNAPAQQRISFLVYKYFQDCLAEVQGGKAGRLQSAAFQGEFLLKCEKGAKCRVMLSIESNSFLIYLGLLFRLFLLKKTAPDIKKRLKMSLGYKYG